MQSGVVYVSGGGTVVGLFNAFFFFSKCYSIFLFKIILCLKETVCHQVSLMLLPEEPELQAVEMNQVCQDNCGR